MLDPGTVGSEHLDPGGLGGNPLSLDPGVVSS